MWLLRAAALVAALLAALPATAEGAGDVMRTWHRLVLELVRHTPTYSPPVASRAFAYLGITGFEAAAQGDPRLVSLSGQLPGLTSPPPRPGGPYDEAVVMSAAMAVAVPHFFGNTGPTGQRAMAAMAEQMAARTAEGLDPDIVARSRAAGLAVAQHVIAWAAADGGAAVENLGFPYAYDLPAGPAAWVPTSAIALQQRPLLPAWGTNRPFAMPAAETCDLPPPPAYSEQPGSPFHAEAMEVYETSRSLTADQTAIARFWSDDPMLSPTPPGHWVTIALDLLDAEDADLARTAETLARLGIGVADGFIANWRVKYRDNLLRPVTYIRRVIDPAWEPILITPPFPEYPSGHSTQSGAAEIVLAALFGPDTAFTDATHADEGMEPRAYPSFRAAADEAGMSRLYGGIHFRSAVVRGLEQGRCVGAFAAALAMRAAP
jgi:hypothetical protein